MHICSSFICRFDFDYIFYSFRDINDNWFNWPINQLRNQKNNILDSLIHAPCAQVLYSFWILIIYFIVFEILTIITLIG